jgi:hypothetical protein
MKKILVFCLLSISASLFSLAQGQTYVWKNGHPLVTDPDSITFVQPDMGARVTHMVKAIAHTEIHFVYPSLDYEGKPIWLSAALLLNNTQVESKHIKKMAMYNHYTIARSDECPTSDTRDPELPEILVPLGFAVVAADYEGFGETSDRVQAYCFGETNARASIDALIAAREWLVKEGYTMSDSIINYGYSQGGQTTVAAIKLAQSEYRGKVHFMKSFAGAGPYDLRLTYRKFLEWERIGQPAVLPMTIITVNELRHMGLDYKTVFKEPLAHNVKSWIISKKFDTDELKELFGSDSIKYYMQPAYLDSTNAEMSVVLREVDKQRLTTGWVPDADTDIKFFHSMKDDIVAPENTLDMYKLFVNSGVTNAVLDTTTLTGLHTESGSKFAMQLMMELMLW